MKPRIKDIEERKRDFLANPQVQAILKRKADQALKFYATADLSAMRKDDDKK